MHWTDELPEQFTTVYTDAFGGRVLLWRDVPAEEDRDEELDNEIAARLEQDVVDNLEDDEDEESARAARKLDALPQAHLVIHANGSECWTHSGYEFALEIIHNRVGAKRHAQHDLFAA